MSLKVVCRTVVQYILTLHTCNSTPLFVRRKSVRLPNWVLFLNHIRLPKRSADDINNAIELIQLKGKDDSFGELLSKGWSCCSSRTMNYSDFVEWRHRDSMAFLPARHSSGGVTDAGESTTGWLGMRCTNARYSATTARDWEVVVSLCDLRILSMTLICLAKPETSPDGYSVGFWTLRIVCFRNFGRVTLNKRLNKRRFRAF